jgi:quercetin dioxygenase-like cupin family protein
MASMEKFVWKESEMRWRAPMPGINFATLTYEEGKFGIHLLKFAAGFSHPPETHEMAEYVYVLKGKSETMIGTETFIIEQGDYFVIPANVPHAVRILEDVELMGIIAPPRPDLR